MPTNGVSRAGSSAICRRPELADDVRLGASGLDTACEIRAELMFQWKHGGRAAQLQDIDGVLVLDDGDDAHPRRYLPDGQRDVGIGRVLAVRQDQPRRRGTGTLVGQAVVNVMSPKPSVVITTSVQ